ncbi:TPA: hypothetical protein ACH3X2_002326 [Trebouxia sp. C0005]
MNAWPKVSCQSTLQISWYWVICTAEEVCAQAFGFTGPGTSQDPLLYKHTCRHKKFHVRSYFAEQYCACRTACIQIMSVGSVFIGVALIHPMVFLTAQLSML